MKQLIFMWMAVGILACNQTVPPTKDQFTTQLELNSIGYYDHFEAFDPPLKLAVNSKPMLIQLNTTDSVGVTYMSNPKSISNSTTNGMVGNLVFMERINGEWTNIGGGEPHLDSIRLDQWVGQEIYYSDCDTGDDYFSADFRFLVARN